MPVQNPTKTSRLSVGRYQLAGRAGTGIAEAYRARDPDTNNLVTVFLFPDEFTDPTRRPDRLSAMLDIVAPLEHPNILRVLDAGRDDKSGYVVSEWAEGTTLARMIEVHSRLPEGNVIRFLAQVGQAMDFTRQGKMALCRVAPTNVLIRNDGVAKVIPFELPGETATPPLPIAGIVKPEFASKLGTERANGKPVPFPELIFSLGTTLHEALTGQVWVRPDPTPPRRRSRTVPSRPAGLTERAERAIRQATDLDPSKRPLSCADFLKLLRSRPLSAGTPKSDVRPPSVATENRRGSVRYALGMGANCQIYSSVFENGPPSSEVWPLVVQDVSVTGIGLLLARRCEPGTELWVELLSGSDRRACSLPVRVVRVRKDQYGHWMHGCTFLTPLAEEELNTLLNCMGRAETV